MAASAAWAACAPISSRSSRISWAAREVRPHPGRTSGLADPQRSRRLLRRRRGGATGHARRIAAGGREAHRQHLETRACTGRQQAVDQIVTATRHRQQGRSRGRGGGRGDRGASARAERDRGDHPVELPKVALDRILGIGAFDLATPWRSSRTSSTTTIMRTSTMRRSSRWRRLRHALRPLPLAFSSSGCSTRRATTSSREGIVAVADDHRRCVLQAVHQIMELRPATRGARDAVEQDRVHRATSTAAIERAARLLAA